METRMTKVIKQNVLGHEVSVLGTVEDPLFRAKDVCGWLGETNPHQMLKHIPEELAESCIKKIKIWDGNIGRITNYLTETGVYYVLMRSRNKEAIKYQMRIAEILKSIRLKGYAVSPTINKEQIASLKKDAESKEALIKVQGNVIRTDDRFVDALEKVIHIYKTERSKLNEINEEDLFKSK